jgi:multiple sugar transport system substrate-binding protein
MGKQSDVAGRPGHAALSSGGAAGQLPGYPGPTGPQPAEALTKYIIVNMFARAAQGNTPDEAAALAEKEIEQIYG